MTRTAGSETASVFRVAKPGALLLLTGTILYFAFQGGEAADSPASISSASVVVEEKPDSVPMDAASRHLDGLLARATPRSAATAAKFGNREAALMHLHGTANSSERSANRDRMISDLESQHRAEPIDPAWSANSEETIVSAAVTPIMIRADFKPQGISADCRSRTCRISARFSSAIDAQDWADRLLTQMGRTISQAKVTVVTLGDGTYEVRMYGARKQA